MHYYIPAHSLKYIVYDIFLESGLVVIVVALALNSNVKGQFIAMKFSGL